jgi:hypothetical protein
MFAFAGPSAGEDVTDNCDPETAPYGEANTDAPGGDSSMNAPANIASNPSVSEAAEVRVVQYDRKALAEELSSQGCVVIENLISPDECRQIAELYPHERHFRSHVHMARHRFGRGEYRYFRYPLPDLVSSLRAAASFAYRNARGLSSPAMIYPCAFWVTW